MVPSTAHALSRQTVGNRELGVATLTRPIVSVLRSPRRVVLLAPESGSGLDRIQAVVGEHVWDLRRLHHHLRNPCGSIETRRVSSPAIASLRAAAHALRQRWARTCDSSADSHSARNVVVVE